MKKIAKWFINTGLGLSILYIGGMFAMIILASGFIYYPEVMMGVDRVLSQPTSGQVFYEIVRHIVSLVTLSFLFIVLSLSTLVLYKTTRLALRVDIEKIMTATKVFLSSK